MGILRQLPLLVVPLIAINIVVLGGGDLNARIMEFDLVSGAHWTMDVGEAIVLLALPLLYVEILKSTRTSSMSILDHGLSLVVFIVFLVEFLLVAPMGTGTTVILMVISLVDVIAGFTVTITAARRDMQFGPFGE